MRMLWIVALIALAVPALADVPPPDGKFLFQPMFIWGDSEVSYQGTGYVDEDSEGQVYGVTSIHFLEFGDPGLFEAIWRWFDEHGWPIRYPLRSPEVVRFQLERGVRRVVALHYAHKPGMARSLNRYVAVLAAEAARDLPGLTPEQTYARFMPNFHMLPIYGGQGMGHQLNQLRRGVQVVVGTPGRVMDHMRRGTLILDDLACLVLDEADEMLRMGFIDDVEWILEHTPPERQIALFSATLPAAIRDIAARERPGAMVRRGRAVRQVDVDVSFRSAEQLGGRVGQALAEVEPVVEQDQVGRVLAALGHHADEGVLLFRAQPADQTRSGLSRGRPATSRGRTSSSSARR